MYIFIRSKHYLSLLMWILLFSLSFSASAQTKDTITWRVTDWPPMYILEGEEKGHGIYDEIIGLLSENLPEFEHKRAQMTTDRSREEMKQGNKVCHPSVLPQKDTIMALSKLDSLLLPHRLIVDKSKLAKFGGKDTISLEEVLNNESLKGGVTLKAYSETINGILDKHKDQKNLTNLPEYKNLIEMLFAGRVDYLIQYTPVMIFMEKTMKQDNFTASLNISETNNEPYLKVYVGCPNNDWGKAVIQQINRILEKERQNKRLEEIQLRWYNPAAREFLQKAYAIEYAKES